LIINTRNKRLTKGLLQVGLDVINLADEYFVNSCSLLIGSAANSLPAKQALFVVGYTTP